MYKKKKDNTLGSYKPANRGSDFKVNNGGLDPREMQALCVRRRGDLLVRGVEGRSNVSFDGNTRIGSGGPGRLLLSNLFVALRTLSNKPQSLLF